MQGAAHPVVVTAAASFLLSSPSELLSSYFQRPHLHGSIALPGPLAWGSVFVLTPDL